MNCRICGDPDLQPLWKDTDGGDWFRCLACGSDTSSHLYDIRKYDLKFLEHQIELGASKKEARANTAWFRDYRGMAPNNSFLDIGCCEGSVLEAMQEMGWAVHGFEVFDPPYMGPHVTVSPTFLASLFPQRYAAVLCREVIEHVEGWRSLLAECRAVTAAGGLFQIQTPRPTASLASNQWSYGWGHLQLLSPIVIQHELEKLGFRVLDRRFWPGGQCWMCRNGD